MTSALPLVPLPASNDFGQTDHTRDQLDQLVVKLVSFDDLDEVGDIVEVVEGEDHLVLGRPRPVLRSLEELDNGVTLRDPVEELTRDGHSEILCN